MLGRPEAQPTGSFSQMVPPGLSPVGAQNACDWPKRGLLKVVLFYYVPGGIKYELIFEATIKK